ncbi:hypothetical protein C4B25_00105 [Mycoplasma todarodis]|uniref:Lipoprotein n=2 Tax=Mycoplasma todarodis TaxID=1937191 RepID=A0A4R0XND9_9MOLU|nr:hypothetical protein C4B25_00105 [Mycoplasma todarodis]
MLTKTKKRIALGTLSSAAIVALPIATVISCGDISKLQTKVKEVKRDKDIDLETDTVRNDSQYISSVVQAILISGSNSTLRNLAELDRRKFKHSISLVEFIRLRDTESAKIASTTQDIKIEFDITKWATEYEKSFLQAMDERVGIRSITFHWSNNSSYKFEIGNGSLLSETLDKLKNVRLSLIDKMESSEYKKYLKKYKKAQLKRDNLELWKLRNDTYSKLLEEVDDIDAKIGIYANKARKIINTTIWDEWRSRTRR